MTALRIILGLCGVAFVTLVLWGLKASMEYGGRQYSIGFGLGCVFTFFLLWAHQKMTGINIFTEGRDDASRKLPK